MTAEPTVLFGVGATKAGTSWLHDYLRTHPDCAFSTIKELHYFDITQQRQVDRHRRLALAEVARLEALQATDPARSKGYAKRAADLRRWLYVLAQDPLGGDVTAYRDYLLGPAVGHRLVGDVTPSYALVPVERLRTMANLAHDVRFVYLMRDPVSRLWSHVRMAAVRSGAGRKASASEVADEAFALFDQVLNDPDNAQAQSILSRGEYDAAVGRLRAAVAPEKLFIGLMEDVMTKPGISALCRFLGIVERPAELDRHVHEGVPLKLDARRRARARAALRAQYDFANQNFAPLPAAWRASEDEVAA